MFEFGSLGFFPLTFSFLFSCLFISAGKPIAEKVGLVDCPGGRKIHSGDVPLVGGIAIFLSAMFSLLLFAPSSALLRVYVLASLSMLVIGALDDRFGIRASHRLLCQAIAAAVMVFGGGLYIDNLGSLMLWGTLETGWFGPLLTVIAVIGSMNAFNMVDGIDGLAGSLSIITLSSIALLMWLGRDPWLLLSVVYIGGIAAYLMFNSQWPNQRLKKIFLGDAGSMVIGFTIAWLLVLGSQEPQTSFRPVTALWLIALPLMDMASVMLRRIGQGRSPFQADRQHFHHICLRMGLSTKQTLFILCGLALTLSTAGIVGEIFKVSEASMLMAFLMLFVVYHWAIRHTWKMLAWCKRLIGTH
ncbi:UDP-N-acetylglucosamine--undecaprenyl-phosphate N-acetylglucosaminephosphotransferase [Marinobacter hydrocarbonoclasticus]|nr:UDP-N-acetylglucosamine--undecaprenyl-phosphate N-acetylglucosaminephosphotransferase [Marinobacter nauticus]